MSAPYDRPDALELIDAVRDFLAGEVAGAVEEPLAPRVRAAADALGIAARELRALPESAAAHARRLARFGCSDDRELVAAIRAGALDDRHAELGHALRRMVWDKIQVTNPRYVRPYTSPDAAEGHGEEHPPGSRDGARGEAVPRRGIEGGQS